MGIPDGKEERYRLLGVVPRESQTPERREPDNQVFTWPHLLVRHAVIGAAVAAFVLLLGVFFNAPLQEMANPNLTPEVAKAPWYFDGLQELLAHFNPLIAGILIPSTIVVGLVALPYIDRNPLTAARNRKVAVLVFTTLLIVFAALTVIGALFRGPGWTWVWPWQELFLEL